MTQKRTFKPVFIVQNVFNNTLFICASHLFLSHQSIIEIVFVTSFIWPINRRIFGHIEPIITFPGQIKLKADKRFHSLPEFLFLSHLQKLRAMKLAILFIQTIESGK